MSRRAPPRWLESLLERLLAATPSVQGVVGDLAESWHRMRRRRPAWLCDLWYVGQALTVVGWRVALRASAARMPGLFPDLRQIVRTLRRQPGFTGVVVITLAVAIGANASVFSIADRLLLRGPEHVQDPDRLVRLFARMNLPPRGSSTTDRFGYVTYTDLAEGADDLVGIGAYATAVTATGRGSEARPLRVGYATWTFFPLLGVRPHLGRFFDPEDEGAWGARNVAVLDHGLWRREYGADPEAIGGTLRIRDEPFVIVGVAPPGFTGADLEPIDVWLPLPVQSRQFRGDWATTRHASWVRIIARIAPGVGTVRAAAQATAVHRAAAAAEAPDELRSGARLALLPLSRNPYGADPPERAVARWLVAVAGIVLLIAIANVSSLQLARGTRRRREIALRLSLGIGRGRLVAMFLLESLVLAGTAAALGLVVAHFGAEVVRAVLLPEVAWPAPAVDGRVLVFSAAAAIACAVVVGVIPAIAAGRMEPARSMQLGTRSGGERGGGLRRALLVVQPGLALVLLVGAGLFVRSLVGIQGIDLGFEPDRVLVAGPSWSATGEEEVREDADGGSAAARAATLAHERFARLPWVESASLSLGLPFYTSFGVRVLPMGADTPPSFTGEGPSVMGVSGEYFATVGTERVRGRLFGPEDVAGSEPVAVVNEAMAAAFWPGEEAVGRCLTVYDDPIPCVRVVGVVEDVKQWFLTENPALAFYVPIEQVREISGPLLLIRPVGDADAAIDRVRAELLHLWPDLPWVDVFTIRRQIDPQVRPWRMGALLFSLFGLLALLVAGSGLYSVLAYLVEQRRHELAVRAALGASSQRILAETVRRGLAPAALGIAIGALLAIPLSTWLEPLLYDTGGHDPLVFGAAAGLLLVVALAGAVVPARRASRVDPMVTLREG